MLVRIMSLWLISIFMVACGEKKTTEGPNPLIVITSPDSPPFEFKDTAQGGDQVIGFDMDVVHKLGEHLGRPVKIVEADFASLIPSLQAGRADMAIAYLTPTAERRKSVEFSDPYYICQLALLTLVNSPAVSEKNLEGKKLGVQLGSLSESTARGWKKDIPGLSLVSLNKIGDLVQDLKNGRLDVALMEEIVAKKIVNSTPGLKATPVERLTEGEVAIAFPKGSPLVIPTNKALKNMKEEIEKIASKWFGQ